MSDRTTHQLVRYEALFKLLSDIQSVDDVLVIGRRVATQWKYFADVPSWRLVIRTGEDFLVMDGLPGEASIATVRELEAWDRHHLDSKLPRIMDVASRTDELSPPAHLAGESIRAVYVLPVVRAGSVLGLVSAAVRHFPVSDLDAKFIHLFGNYLAERVSDITRRKQAEQFRRHVERIIRHDIKSPLSGLHALASCALDDPVDEGLREMIPFILNSVQRVVRLVDASDAFLKMESGAYQPDAKWFDLGQTCANIELGLRTLARSMGVRLVLPDGDLRAYGEEFLVEDMLMNLVRNAVEASPEEGVVTLSCRKEKDSLRIDIHNHGAVPEDVRAVFFEKYATFGKPWGTGLGTYSAQLIARAHGGSIGFVTSKEEGTTVNVVLPHPATQPEARAGHWAT
ncbi:MAG: HAMP domain-containing histidine kinase [Desulfovibrio sp.]|nr:HAMP domain-containing histidine kinase [Desulfovibrio sp.]MBI4961303.1 HAMP domain-containing histidine kinase [Desulfovibrio sp.]